ncbi:DUF1330 domain-containing protein [Micromonospora sp. WMMC241]|uniref:DUF1330 domain-containing protein n=1 Tax=Micromonospora sp. WMMC241 TaxID=3015159 RepID=UPI0022B601A2|nr:DUF1330 domain-containing protein [Micromonospora sp. WMMC241]MCZ7439472.1 DUF1330 domain-containing protein [Micromonospora sp. WMMC241]
MPAFALANLRPAQLNEEILEYIEKVQSTFAPFGGRFRVHGADPEVLEGQWPGTVVIVEFPDVERARAWYASPAYQEILPLRTRNIEGETIILDGVGPDYDAARTAARMRASLG